LLLPICAGIALLGLVSGESDPSAVVCYGVFTLGALWFAATLYALIGLRSMKVRHRHKPARSRSLDRR